MAQLPVPNPPTAPLPYGVQTPAQRADTAQQLRVEAATFERARALPGHVDNGDEARYASPAGPFRIGSYSKGLAHDQFGEVTKASYDSLLKAVTSGLPADFENIQLGGDVKLVNPQAGLAFDLLGADSHALSIPPSPEVASAERAAEMVELYWMALCRDVPFSEYGKEPLSKAAIADLSNLPAFTGPKVGGKVTAETLFRGATPGETDGPYMSQFFLQNAPFGDLAVNDPMGNPAQQYYAYQPDLDYMTDEALWLAVQNGMATVHPVPANGPFGANIKIGPRYLFSGRGGAAFVHVDELYQAYFMAALNLLDGMKPGSYDPNNPYSAGNSSSKTQAGFGTFGNPHVATLVAEVATRALKAQWYQKWFVHRTLRPEAFGGLVHFTKLGKKTYPLHASVLNSPVLDLIFQKYRTYFLPMAFPEGSPQHPSYGSGHATVAGACATIIKAFFDETMPFPKVYEATTDGMALKELTGVTLKVGKEANKIAGNVGMFRNHAGVHWRSDHVQSIYLGEQIAISILQDGKYLYNEPFKGWTFSDFKGNSVTI